VLYNLTKIIVSISNPTQPSNIQRKRIQARSGAKLTWVEYAVRVTPKLITVPGRRHPISISAPVCTRADIDAIGEGEDVESRTDQIAAGRVVVITVLGISPAIADEWVLSITAEWCGRAGRQSCDRRCCDCYCCNSYARGLEL
jgi:hypothetical protein